MLRFLGVILVSGVIALGSLLLGHHENTNFIIGFARDQSLLIMATALAINIATITFLVGSLLGIEEKVGRESFQATRKELKDNVIAMAFLFVGNTLIVSAVSDISSRNLWSKDNILAMASMTVLLAFGALVLETSMLVLKIKSFSKSPK